MSQTSINLGYLLWRTKAPREEWSVRLAAWARCDVKRADDLLRTGELRVEEQQHVAQVCQISEEDLLFADLLHEARIDILNENIVYLTESLGHGGKVELATRLKVNASTISRWCAGVCPSVKHLQQIHDFFQLPTAVDLRREPVFLWSTPFTAKQQQAWIHQRIDALDAATVQALFPALQRLLRER